MSAASASSTHAVDDFLTRPQPSALSRAATGIGRFVRNKPLGAFGAFMLVLVAIVAVFSPVIAPDFPNQVHVGDDLQTPNGEYWFGTDGSARDIFTSIIFGCQITALVGAGTVILVSFLSLFVGVLSGFFGGRSDFIIQRFVDVWLSFPAIFLILSLVAILQTGGSSGFFGLGRGPEVGPDPQGGEWIWNTLPRTTIVILVLGVVLAGGAPRVVRSAVLATKANPYIEAATVLGATNTRIILKHVIPNIMPVVIVLATVQLGTAVLAEATLSFLGVGVTNFPTWGQMLSGQTRQYAETHPHIAIFPGMAIFFAVFGFNMLGDALRDVLDPRLRGSR